jgi:hypothetical protein
MAKCKKTSKLTEALNETLAGLEQAGIVVDPGLKPNYLSLDEPEINPSGQHYGLFQFPDKKIGGLYGEKPFVTIYFDNEDDFKHFVGKVGLASSHTKEHPMINTKLLLELIGC